MKKQKLSTDDTVNRQLLWLPEEIIHHIFSFLPSTRQVAKTCLISKCWLHAWRSYFEGPSLIFILAQEEEVDPGKTKQFCEFVDHAMSMSTTRRRKKFVLGVPITFAGYEESMSKWINIAIDNHVQEMDLSAIGYLPCKLPDLERVLNNGSLRSLALKLWKSPKTYWINLPNLVTLTLYMEVFNGKFLERFLQGCPLLETVKIICSVHERALEIKVVTGHQHLKTVCLSVEDPKLVHIDAPNLETLRCNTIKTGQAGSIFLSIHNCLKLKHLDLEFLTLDTEWFQGLLKQLASLETLKLKFVKSSSSFDMLSISNTSIKKLVLNAGSIKRGVGRRKLLSLLINSLIREWAAKISSTGYTN